MDILHTWILWQGKHCRQFRLQHRVIDILYWSVRSSSRRGGGWGKGGVRAWGYCYLSPLQVSLFKYMIIWCKIQVIINPLFYWTTKINQAAVSLLSDTVVWTFMCRFIFSLKVKVLLQTSHENDFSPECVILCLVRWLSLENCFPQTSHSNGFSPVWILYFYIIIS